METWQLPDSVEAPWLSVECSVDYIDVITRAVSACPPLVSIYNRQAPQRQAPLGIPGFTWCTLH